MAPSLRVLENDPQIADRVAVNYREAGLAPRHRAMLDFAVKVSAAAHMVEQADFDLLAAAGFSEADAWDIGAIAAFFGMSNRLANLSGMRPNDEFFLMGRLPRRSPAA